MSHSGVSIPLVVDTHTDAPVRLPFDRLPDPCYEQHPAYGRAFPKPSPSLRLKALTTLAPWVLFVFVKKVLLFDRLGSLPDYAGPMSDGGVLRRLAAGPRYVPLVLRAVSDSAQRLISGGPVAVGDAASHLLMQLRDYGIAMARFSAEEMVTLNNLLAASIMQLLKRRDSAGTTTFQGNQIWLNVRESSNVYALLDRVLEERGILGAASGYLRRPVKVTHVTLQINDTRDAFHHNKFADVKCPDPATNYMHMDTTYEILKCMIYLTEVNDYNGPFCYVRGSHKLRVGLVEGLVRRAMDRCGLTGYSRASREMFMALPRFLRKKATFGSDLRDGTPAVDALLAAEYHATSADGNVALFDNLGVHRGALVKRGERRILVATLG